MVTYKTMPNFVLKTIGEDHVLIKIANGESKDLFVYVLNDSGAFIWEHLSEKKSREQLLKLIMEKYGIAYQQAESDVDSFLTKSITEGFISEFEEGK